MAASCIGSKSDALVKSSAFLTAPQFGAHHGGKRRECRFDVAWKSSA